MNVSPVVWLITCAVVAGLFAFDFAVVSPHRPTLRGSAGWSAVYIAIALAFGAFVTSWWGGDYGVQYFAGYVTEEALSGDNLFVFTIIMSALAVPRQRQQRVLLAGIAIALVLRGLFIALGAAVLNTFSWVFYLFGAFLIFIAYKLIREHGDEQENEIKLAMIVQRLVPTVTPMVLALVVIGFADLLFALESIPAIYGLTDEPYIVFTANAFALMGLRHLYFLISGLLARLVYLSYGLAIILAFIGVKLVLDGLHGHAHRDVPQVPTSVSLAVVVLVLAATAVASLPRRGRKIESQPKEEQWPGRALTANGLESSSPSAAGS
jgi:tellurite resistance protein TerC